MKQTAVWCPVLIKMLSVYYLHVFVISNPKLLNIRYWKYLCLQLTALQTETGHGFGIFLYNDLPIYRNSVSLRNYITFPKTAFCVTSPKCSIIVFNVKGLGARKCCQFFFIRKHCKKFSLKVQSKKYFHLISNICCQYMLLV